MTTTPWKEIRRGGSPEREAAIAQHKSDMREQEEAYVRTEASLAELRHRRQVTQSELATALGIDPTSLSRRERSADPHLSTIREQVEALGGRLELVARFDEEAVTISI